MPEQNNSQQKQIKKTPFYFYIILVLIPVIFFILLEISLRIFGYGREIPQWLDASQGKSIINPDVAFRYFNNVQNVPTTIEDVFDQKKKENSYRVFVLGGSSAAGFPYMPMGSFSRYIRKRLELAYPTLQIEVVNLGLSAVNTYTIRDLLPEVLNQNPDLIIIYAGHNEYYGALGVGSMESLGTSRSFVNLILYLNKYRTVQLIRNILSSIFSVFISNESANTGTLMSRMAKDQYINFNSEKFNAGLEQYEGNMRDILEMIKEKNVPVIIGRLASNLKDQKPFVSADTPGYPSAGEIYKDAMVELQNKNLKAADSLFTLAKDLDALRFRAPEKINEIIEKLADEYNIISVAIDSVLAEASEDGITGNELMTDHLHPNIEGFHLMGNAFYEAMNSNNLLPAIEPKVPFESQDSLTRELFMFSRLDSTIGNYRITMLKNDWPFIERDQKKNRKEILHPADFIDSIAALQVEGKITWEVAHLNAAKVNYERGNLTGYLKHMDILIYQYPVVVEYYDQTALGCLQLNEFDIALKYLHKRYEMEPGEFCTKWIGIISLSRGESEKAIPYLEKSIELKPDDAQTLYNLAGAYSRLKKYDLALTTVNRCLNINPDYPQAQNLKQQLTQAIYQQSRK